MESFRIKFTDSGFGINCGGPQITSSSGLAHDQDNETLGPATYYLTTERRWGVSNVGLRDNPANTASTQCRFTNTIDSEIFQIARLSADRRWSHLEKYW